MGAVCEFQALCQSAHQGKFCLGMGMQNGMILRSEGGASGQANLFLDGDPVIKYTERLQFADSLVQRGYFALQLRYLRLTLLLESRRYVV